MKTSRHRLLEYVQAHPGVTSRDLSRALKMTEANARHHLSILQDEGLVGIVGQQPAKGKGRPAKLYGPAENIFGHNLDKLSSALLVELDAVHNSEDGEGVIKRVAQRMAKSNSEVEHQSSGMSSHLTQRLYQAVQRLNELNYRARWEAHAAGPHMILGHCPYAAILEEHPELCQMDALLLEQLCETPMRQIEKLTRLGRGLPFCVFRAKEGN